MIKVKLLNSKELSIPKYATIGSAGMDLRANINESITLAPMHRHAFPTGISISIPQGMEAQIRPRSGMAFKNGITVLNSPGTIDNDYIGEIKVILVNLSDVPYTIEKNDRIAQMVFSSYEKCEFEVVDELEKTERGDGGFGHSGKK